jgi:ribonuclease E
VLIHTEPVPEKRTGGAVNQVKAVAAASRTEPAPQTSGRSRRRRGGDNAPAESTPDETMTDTAGSAEGPAAVAAEVPPATGSGIVAPATPQLTTATADDDYDISGYDLSRYDANGHSDAEPLQLTGADDPDAGDDDEEDDDVVGAGAGGRRRSRRGGARRRTRP